MTLPLIAAEPNEPAPAAVPPLPGRRFQFSLATLMWLTTFLACLAALWAMYREVELAKAESRAARNEVEKYRGEMGYLNVIDSHKIYARKVIASGTDRETWRIYLPPGPQFWLRASSNNIPENDIPNSQTEMTIESGEHLVNLFEEKQDGKWHFFIKVADGSGVSLTGTERAGGSVDGFGVFGKDQVSAQIGSPLILLRSRKWKAAEPCDGLMIWIEEAK